MTYFDIRIPGLKMTVVQADGQNIQPVEVAEFRIAPGETWDVIVQPSDRAYTLFAEAMDRSGYTRGTLAPHPGMPAAIPPRRPRPLRTMADMGMGKSDMQGMAGMNSGGKNKKQESMAGMQMEEKSMPGMDMSGHDMHSMDTAEKRRSEIQSERTAAEQHKGMSIGGMQMDMPGPGHLQGPSLPGSPPLMHGPDTHGPGNSMIAMLEQNRLDDPGSGFENATGKVLVYEDVKSLVPQTDRREPEREIEHHITGNMERYMWSFDGKKYSQARAPIPFGYGERLRLILVNDTMMEHPIHLHGMWMELENGGGAHQPRKHTISVKPAERLSVAITANAPGRWAFHCHLLLHMKWECFGS